MYSKSKTEFGFQELGQFSPFWMLFSKCWFQQYKAYYPSNYNLQKFSHDFTILLPVNLR